MDHLQYSVITNNAKEVRARWTGTCIELAVFGATWSDVQVEWHHSVGAAAERFQWLVAHNSKPVTLPPNKLTLPEARAIARHRGYGGNVTELLYTLALMVLNADKPVIEYAPIDWNEDDGSNSAFDVLMQERNEKLQYAERKAQEWNNR